MRFAKYHGIGNDFVMVADPDDALRLSPAEVRYLCDRRFGIGADGVIRVAPAGDDAELFMDYANADGSIGEMCGNGIRCLALFAREEGLTSSSTLRVLTRAGVKLVEVVGDRVRVDMGPPMFNPAEVPVTTAGGDALHVKIELPDAVYEAACVSMGNPHAVIAHEDLAGLPLTTLGPAIERHPMFPNGTNVEWIRVEGADRIAMRVWERGSGETLACGTGACAVAVVGQMLYGTRERVTVALPGGELLVEWTGTPGDPASVFLTGPAVKTFAGEVDLEGAA